MAILYFVKRKRFVGRRHLESLSLFCFMAKKGSFLLGLPAPKIFLAASRVNYLVIGRRGDTRYLVGLLNGIKML